MLQAYKFSKLSDPRYLSTFWFFVHFSIKLSKYSILQNFCLDKQKRM